MVICRYDAATLEDEAATVNEAVCKGCGLCAAACIGGAVLLELYDNEQIIANIGGHYGE